MEDLNISLITVMAYNEGFILNLKEMFDSLNVPAIRNPPMMRKGKEIDIKNIKVPAGTIISAKFGNWIKGLDRVPSGKYKFHVNIRKGKYKLKKAYYSFIFLNSSIKRGTTSCRSPTIP